MLVKCEYGRVASLPRAGGPKSKSAGESKKLDLHALKFACLMMPQHICQSGS